MQVGQENLEPGLVALRQHLDGSVVAVAHPPRQPQTPRLIEGGRAIAHALHAPVHHGVQAAFARGFAGVHSLLGAWEAHARAWQNITGNWNPGGVPIIA